MLNHRPEPQIYQKVGEEHASEFEIHYPAGNPITLPTGIEFNILDEHGDLLKASGPFIERGLGSNAWSVSGARTDSGTAFLCNDMHLPLAAPFLWYQVHLIAEDVNVTGISLPGPPFVLVGHNANISALIRNTKTPRPGFQSWTISHWW